MGYHFEDFFDDHILPDMKKLFSSEPSDDIADKFLNILKNSIQQHRGDDLARRLLSIATDEYDRELSPDEYILACFNKRYDEAQLSKLEYLQPTGAKINVDYLAGAQEEQELQRVCDMHREWALRQNKPLSDTADEFLRDLDSKKKS